MKDFLRQLPKIQKKAKSFFEFFNYLLPPLILFVIFIFAFYINKSVRVEIQKQQMLKTISSQALPYPYLSQPFTPYLSAEAAIIMENDSKAVLFSKNPNLRFSMASTTKLMTALASLDYFGEGEVLTVYRKYTEGSRIGLEEGEKFYLFDLLYALLLPSANDVAYTIADNFPGGQKEFIVKMNEKARQLHLVNTVFSDPAGLNDDGNFTTVVDLARLASEAIKNKTISQITGTKQRIITNIDKTKEYNLENLNKLLGIYGVTGIKTGFTEGAGGVLVTAEVENDHTYILVVMKSEDRFLDTLRLLSLISQNVSFFEPSDFKSNY